MEQKERVTRAIMITVATALVGAIFSVCVGLVLATNQYRTTVKRDQAERLVRQMNLLILLRDELARVQAGIDRGTFQVKADGHVLQSAGYEWPTQIWSNLKWNAELLNVEPSLVQLLANVYDEITHAEHLRSKTADAVNGAFTSFMETMLQGMGAPEKVVKKAGASGDPQFDIDMKAYTEAQARVQQQLPGTLAALDIKINELRARVASP